MLKINIFRKIHINHFAGGIIFGAIFSLVVNVITINIQDTIQKQRVLEALENEIVNNEVLAYNAINLNDSEIKQNKPPSYLHDFKKYSNRVWISSEALKYTMQLDPAVQNKLIAYYNVTIDGWNEDLDKNNEWSKQNMTTCHFPRVETSPKDKKTCSDVYQSLLQNETFIAANLGQTTIGVLKVFHPTQDRLQNLFLKLLMGDKARVVLSGNQNH